MCRENLGLSPAQQRREAVLRGRMVRWLAAAVASSLLFLAGFVLRPGTAAQGSAPPQVSVGQRADLAADILVNVPVTITCAPRSPDTGLTASVNLEQAVGGRIAHGGISFASSTAFATGGGPFPNGVACDNAAHSFTASILADTGGAAFSEGPSIISVTVQVCTIQGGFNPTDCVQTNVGPRVIAQVSKKE